MSATARIPIGVPDLTQPLPNLLAGAFDRIKDAQIEVQLGVYGDLSSSGVSVTATKSVAAKELHKLASVDGWTVGVDAYVGPREQKPGIGPGEIEITAKRSVNLSTNSDKPLPEQINDAKAIAKQAQTASSGVGARIR